MNKAELKQLIREAVEEIMNKDFAPMGVAETERIEEGGPPNFPKKMRARIIAKYKKKYPNDKKRANKAAFGTMWKIFYAKKNGNKKINEMWAMYESAGLNEADEMGQDEEHDETDMSNPEENREVELANQIKKLANELLSMHGVEDDESDGEDVESEAGGEDTEK